MQEMGVEIEGFPAAALSSRARRRQQQPVANLSLVVPSLMPHNCPTRGLRRHRTTPGRLRHLIEASARVEASPENTELGAAVLCPLGWAARMAINAGVERRDGKNHVVATSRYFHSAYCSALPSSSGTSPTRIQCPSTSSTSSRLLPPLLVRMRGTHGYVSLRWTTPTSWTRRHTTLSLTQLKVGEAHLPASWRRI